MAARPPRPRPGPARAAACAVVTAVALALPAGCGSSDEGGSLPDRSTTVPSRAPGELSDADAERLAQMLYRNHRAGGARVSVSTEHTPGSAVVLTGTVDFVDHRGHLSVATTDPSGRTTDEELYFAEDAVYDRAGPEAGARLAGAGMGHVEWIRRPPAPDRRPVDQVIGLLVSLSAARPDNPQVLAQQGLAYDRTETVAGVAADVFTSPTGSAYWISVGDDRMVRFQGVLAGFSGPVVIDVTEPGPHPIELPGAPVTAEVDQVPPA